MAPVENGVASSDAVKPTVKGEYDAVQEKATLNPSSSATAAEAAAAAAEDVGLRMSASRIIPFPPCRVIFAFLGFFCFFNLYSLRVNLSVALVSMVNMTYMKELDRSHSSAASTSNVTAEVECERPDSNETSSQPAAVGEFEWDSQQQGIILSAFFYGYIVTQLPGGMLAERFGGKIVLLVGIFWTTFWTMLTPVICQAGDFPGLVAIRILEGIGEAVAYPAMHVMLSSWAPPLERGRMATFVYAGAQIGTVVTMPVSGVLCQNVSWQSVFYVFGAIGLVWCVLWIFLVYDKPSKHPRIDPSEKLYIESSQGPQRSKGNEMKTPWLKMATSPAVYALMMANFAHNWGNFFLLTVTPQFLSYILKFNIQSSGSVAGAPYLAMWIGMLIGGAAGDFILSRHLMSVTLTRKIFVIFGLGGPAVCLVGIGYVGCDTSLAVALLIMAGGLIGVSWGGWGVNHLDIAPPFAGTLFGVTNCIATIPGFVAPAVVGALTYRNQTRAAWRTCFYITGAVLMAGTIVFLIIGTGKRQKWSIPEANREDPENLVPINKDRKEVEDGAADKNVNAV